MKKSNNFFYKTKDQGFNFVSLDMDSARLIFLTDVSFCNAEGLKYQLEYVLLVTYGEGKGNSIHHGRNKCRRIARGVMEAEVQSLLLGFCYAYLVQYLAQEIMGRCMSLESEDRLEDRV